GWTVPGRRRTAGEHGAGDRQRAGDMSEPMPGRPFALAPPSPQDAADRRTGRPSKNASTLTGAGLRVLDVTDPAGDEWLLGPHDVYHTQGFHRYAAGSGEGRPYLAIVGTRDRG